MLTLTSLSVDSSTQITLTFNEPVTIAPAFAGPESWTISHAVDATIADVKVKQVVTAGNQILLTTSEQTDGKAYTLHMPGQIWDTANGDFLVSPVDQAFTGIGVPPVILMVNAIDERSVDVVFDEPLLEADVLTPGNYQIFGPEVDESDGTVEITSVEKITDLTYRIHTSHMRSSSSFFFFASGIRDLALNPMPQTDFSVSIDTIADQGVTPGSPYSFTPTTHNPSGLPLTFSLIGSLPTGLTFNTSTGTISGTVSGGFSPRGLQIQATNGINTGTSNSFQMTLVIPEPSFLYAVGFGEQQTQITFDSVTVNKQLNNNIQNWLCKVRKSDGAIMWATKILELPGANSGFVPFSIAAMSDGVVVMGSMDSGGYTQVTASIYDTTSDTTPIATHDPSLESPVGTEAVYIIKYDTNGVFKWFRDIRAKGPNAGNDPPVLQALQAAFVRTNDNIVVGCYLDAISQPIGGGKTSLHMAGLNGASDVTVFSGIGQSAQTLDVFRVAALVEIDPLGAFVQATHNDVDFNTTEPVSFIANAYNPMSALSKNADANGGTAYAAYLFSQPQSTIYKYGKGEAGEFDSPALTSANFSQKAVVVKLDASLHTLWAADITQEVSPGDKTWDAMVTSIDVDSAGNVYVAGACTENNNVPGTLTARSAGWTTPQIQVPIPINNTATRSIPFYAKYSSSGVIQWLKIVSGTGLSHVSTGKAPFTIAIINDVPYIGGTVGFPADSAASIGYTLDDGLASQVTVMNAHPGPSAPYTRGFVAKLDPTDGHVTWLKEQHNGAAAGTGDAYVPSIKTNSTPVADPPPTYVVACGTQNVFVAATERNGPSNTWGPGEANETTVNVVQSDSGSIGLLSASTGTLAWAKALPTTSNAGPAQNQIFAIVPEKTVKF